MIGDGSGANLVRMAATQVMLMGLKSCLFCFYSFFSYFVVSLLCFSVGVPKQGDTGKCFLLSFASIVLYQERRRKVVGEEITSDCYSDIVLLA